jgi:hypothetical protein
MVSIRRGGHNVAVWVLAIMDWSSIGVGGLTLGGACGI